MIFFHFLKIIFDISTSKRSKKYKPNSILTKKKIKFTPNAGANAETNGLEVWDNLHRDNALIFEGSVEGPQEHIEALQVAPVLAPEPPQRKRYPLAASFLDPQGTDDVMC